MKNKLTIITAYLEEVFSGDPAPSFKSEEFAGLMSAISSITGIDSADPACAAVYEAIGRETVLLLLDRLQASMTTERTLAVMRGNNQAPL